MSGYVHDRYTYCNANGCYERVYARGVCRKCYDWLKERGLLPPMYTAGRKSPEDAWPESDSDRRPELIKADIMRVSKEAREKREKVETEEKPTEKKKSGDEIVAAWRQTIDDTGPDFENAGDMLLYMHDRAFACPTGSIMRELAAAHTALAELLEREQHGGNDDK